MTKGSENLNRLGFGFIWNAQNLPTSKYKRKILLRKLQQRSRDQYKAEWRAKLNGPDQPKLRTYRKFKQDHQHENYLKTVKDTDKRIALTKFRISNHKLEIETGRYNGTPENEQNMSTM